MVSLAKRGILLFFAFLFLFSYSLTHTAFADEKVYAFDYSDIYADFNELGIEPETYVSPTPEFITLLEYGYDNDKENYGIYVYVNVGNLNIQKDSNSIQLASLFDISSTTLGEAKDYKKFELKFCSKADNIFKFRVLIDNNFSILQNELNSKYGKRCYSVSGIELWEVDKENAKDYNVGRSFTFSNDTESDGLNVTIETIVLRDLKTTAYRPNGNNSKSVNTAYQDQINSVYFTIPKSYFKDFGGAYDGIGAIKMEWYEFVTSNILLVNHSNAFNGGGSFLSGFSSQVGVNTSRRFSITNTPEYLGYIHNSHPTNPSGGSNDRYYYEAYGLSDGQQSYWNNYTYLPGSRISSSGLFAYDSRDEFYLQTPNVLGYAFYTENAPLSTGYDNHKTSVEMGGISGNTLKEYMFGVSYDELQKSNWLHPRWVDSGKFGNTYAYQKLLNYGLSSDDYVKIGNKAVFKDLFLPDIQNYRKNIDGVQCGFNGKSVLDFSIDDVGVSGSRTQRYTGLGAFLAGLVGKYQEDTEDFEYNVIEVIDNPSVISSMSNMDIIDTYLVSADDVDEFKAVAVNASRNDEELVLIRFANTEYRTYNPILVKQGLLTAFEDEKEHLTVCNETVFMDLDVIQLKFSDGGNLVTIPLVSSPVDHVAGVAPNIPQVFDFSILYIILAVCIGGAVVSVWIKNNAR